MLCHLSKGVCPSGQQWEVPEAHAGELETCVIRAELLGREGPHAPLSGPIKGGQVGTSHLKGDLWTLKGQEEQGFIEMQGM